MRYHGKYKAKGRKLPLLSWLLLLTAVISLFTGTVAAYLSAKTDAVTNVFSAEDGANPSISETFDKKEKKNAAVNVGKTDYAVYVRAAVVVTWKDEDGRDDEGNALEPVPVLGTMPVKGTDYEITYNETDWFQKDGFWYCKTAVGSGGSTPVLIESCSPRKAAPADGYALNVEILAQTIQALGTTDGQEERPAVTDAWGVTVDAGGTLTP